MPGYTEVAAELHGDWLVLRLAGEVDVVSAPRLRDRLVALVTDGDTRLVVDLGGVVFLDSMGLAALLSGLKRARAHGGDLRLCGASGHLQHVLALTRLDQAFTVTDTLAEALAVPEEAADG